MINCGVCRHSNDVSGRVCRFDDDTDKTRLMILFNKSFELSMLVSCLSVADLVADDVEC
jgi:hypothetical protein